MDPNVPDLPEEGFLRGLLTFAWSHKAFWIIPILLVLGLIIGLRFVSYAVAPFHYTVM